MRPCIEGQTRCKSCIKIHSGARSQFDSTYPHGHMSEPIPEHSHIFGGTWYEERVRDWGAPTAEVIALALLCQAEARQFYTIQTSSKADSVSTSHDMGRPKKIVETAEMVETAVVPEKRSRKPKIGIMPAVEIPLVEKPVPKSAPKPRKKATKEEPVPEVKNICKEVVIPTYIEEKIEEFDTHDYEIEYVILTHIEIEKTLYYHDSKKQKIYEIIKNKEIGPYVGRYCPNRQIICTDVADSDDEKDE
jgi:hypothetical protein